MDAWVQVLALQVTGRACLSFHICRVGESFLPVPLGSCRLIQRGRWWGAVAGTVTDAWKDQTDEVWVQSGGGCGEGRGSRLVLSSHFLLRGFSGPAPGRRLSWGSPRP